MNDGKRVHRMNEPEGKPVTDDRPAAAVDWPRRLCTIALAGYWAALFVSTHIPMPDLGDLPKNSDKIMHFVAYAGLSFLIGFRWSFGRGLTRQIAARVFAITAAYAVVDELLQTIPVLHRTGDVYDVLADCCGSLIGLSLLFGVRAVTGYLRGRAGNNGFAEPGA